MANLNSTAGYQNLPAQAITTATETTLLVPASGNFGSGLPSPVLLAGAGLFIGFNPDIAGGIYDGHPFIVSLIGKVTTGTTSTFAIKLYEVPGAIATAGTSATVANDHVVVSLAATSVASATQNFIVQAQFLWDSSSKILNGSVLSAMINGVNIAANSGGTTGLLTPTTSLSSPAVGISDLNFIPSFTFATANAGNAVTITEFLIDRA